MNRHIFIYELRRELSFMSPEDLDAAVGFYEEYFADAGPEYEKEALEGLGSPSALAAKIRREYEDGRKALTGRDLALPDNDAEKTDGSWWEGQHYTGPNPPWHEDYKTWRQSEDGNGNPQGAGQSQKQDAPNNNGDIWSQRAEEWGRKAGEWGQRFGYNAGVWSRKAEEKAQEWASRAEAKAGEWSAKAEENASTQKERNRDERYRARTERYEAREDRKDERRKRRYEYSEPRGERQRPYELVWLIIGLFIAGTVVLPVAFGLATAVFSVLGSLFAAGIALVVSGIAVILSGLIRLPFLPDALLRFGIGLLLCGIGIPLVSGMAWSIKRVAEGIANGVRALVGRFRDKRGEQR